MGGPFSSGKNDNFRSIFATVWTHVALDGVSDGALGVALDIGSAATRLVRAGIARIPAGEEALRQRIVSEDGEPVRTASGRTLAVDGALPKRGARPGEMLILPGLSAATEPELAALLRRGDVTRTAEILARSRANGALVAASCSATFVLAASGVLDAQEATTSWFLAPSFARRFPAVKLRADLMVVEATCAWTAGAALAHADLMLALVARMGGPSLAHLIAKYLVLDERPSQARYLVTQHLRSADPLIRKLEAWITQNLDRRLTACEMAHAVATSPRTLARKVESALGITPHKFAQRLRIARATHLLESTDRSIDDIAAAVGYADPAAFRRVFRRETGDTPKMRRATPM